MHTVSTSSGPTDISEVPRILSNQITSLLHNTGTDSHTESVVHPIRISVDELDLLTWLGAQHRIPRFFWAGRDGNSPEIAGVGVADSYTAQSFDGYDELLHELKQIRTATNHSPRYFGGIRFQPNGSTSTSWEPYGSYRFVLPRFELYQAQEQTWLQCNIILPDDTGRISTILDEIDHLEFGGPARNSVTAPPIARTDIPSREEWTKNIEGVHRAFEEGDLEKIVLARQTNLRLPSRIDPVQLLANLRNTTSRCFYFLFQPSPDTAFLGASPERLYHRRRNRVLSEAVAGTRPRGRSPEEDEQLGSELQSNSKDVEEHAHVERHIHQTLERISTRVTQAGTRSLMKLANKQHLISRFEARLSPDVEDAELLEALHPTPAVGGSPTDEAMKRIAEIEGFDRGWYAGPVGWIGNDEAEFAVALRCGLIEDTELHLYSGAGIVRESRPESEWREIEHKIVDFIDILTE